VQHGMTVPGQRGLPPAPVLLQSRLENHNW